MVDGLVLIVFLLVSSTLFFVGWARLKNSAATTNGQLPALRTQTYHGRTGRYYYDSSVYVGDGIYKKMCFLLKKCVFPAPERNSYLSLQ